MKRIELLAPAGSFAAFKAAVDNGADAVYLGGSSFSARAFASNFDNDEMKKAVDYAHLRNVRIFVTLNTLLNEFELDAAFKQAQYYYSINVDALIIQDLGLYYRLKKELPDFEIHASTQMHVHNLNGVKNVKAMGFKRVVLARESSLDLIKEACKEKIEIEVFCHGALCVSYSGQCLMSAITNQRSANRGMCAQCCRMSYELYDENFKKIKTDTEYLLSPKDMFLLEHIPDLIEAGVCSLKIEGRMKSPAYVAYVVRMYRKAIDAYYDNEEFNISDDELKKLKVLFNRGFTDAYLLNKEDNIFGNKRPNHQGIEIGKVVNVYNGNVQIKLNEDVKQFDGIRIIGQKIDAGTILNKIEIKHQLVNSAFKGDVISIELKDKVKVGDHVVKTLDNSFEKELSLTESKHMPINLKINARANNKLYIEAEYLDKVFSYDSGIVAEKALNKPLSVDDLRKSFSKLNDTAYVLNEIKCDIDNIFLPVSKLNEIRRNFVCELDKFILNSFTRTNLYPDYEVHEEKEEIKEDISNLNDDIYFEDVVKYDNYSNNEKICIGDIGGIFLNNKYKIANYTLNVTNSYAYEFLKLCGFDRIVLSSELNSTNISVLIDAYKSRHEIDIYPLVFAYSRRVLMNIRRNPFKEYQPKALYLKGWNDWYKIRYKKDYLELVEKEVYINKELDRNRISYFAIIEDKNEEKDFEINCLQ